MKPIAENTYDFAELREIGAVYVDKTGILRDMITHSGHKLGNYELANAIREEISNFYIQIKRNESCVRFMMMTGVTQFAKMSVFSALSKLTDISLDVEAATLLGYTEEELHFYFDEHMRAHADVMGLGFDNYMDWLRKRCNGYLFSGKVKTFGEKFTTLEEKRKLTEAKLKAIKVYNPVAVGINLAKRNEVFESSWAATGSASVMMNYISNHAIASMDYENIPNIRESRFNSCNLKELPAITVLYQSGYLTIKDYDPTPGGTPRLSLPLKGEMQKRYPIGKITIKPILQ